jgi:uncharacterized membrane protein
LTDDRTPPGQPRRRRPPPDDEDQPGQRPDEATNGWPPGEGWPAERPAGPLPSRPIDRAGRRPWEPPPPGERVFDAPTTHGTSRQVPEQGSWAPAGDGEPATDLPGRGQGWQAPEGDRMAAWRSGTQAGRGDLDEQPPPPEPAKPDLWRPRPADQQAAEPGAWRRPSQDQDPDQGRWDRSEERRTRSFDTEPRRPEPVDRDAEGAGPPWQAQPVPPGHGQGAGWEGAVYGDQGKDAWPGDQAEAPWRQDWGAGATPRGKAAAGAGVPVHAIAAVVWTPGVVGGLVLALGWLLAVGSLVTAGSLLCLLGFVGAVVLAVVDRRPEVRFNAVESASLDVVTAAVAFVITAAVAVTLLQSILFPLLQVLYAGLRAFVALRALQGVRVKLPIIGDLAEVRANR